MAIRFMPLWFNLSLVNSQARQYPGKGLCILACLHWLPEIESTNRVCQIVVQLLEARRVDAMYCKCKALMWVI
jgi:hypothetical protein